MEEGDIAIFVLLRTWDWHYRRKCVPTNHRTSKRPTIIRRSPWEEKNTYVFLNEPLSGAQRQVCAKVSANIRRSDGVGVIRLTLGWVIDRSFTPVAQ